MSPAAPARPLLLLLAVLQLGSTSQVTAGRQARRLLQSCTINANTFCQSLSGLFASPCDPTCNAFLSCGSGMGALENCPSGLRFNNVSKVCDWPSNVPCPYPSSTSPSPSSTPIPAPTSSPSPTPSPSPTLTPTGTNATYFCQGMPTGGGGVSGIPHPHLLPGCTGTNTQRATCFCQGVPTGLYADVASGCTNYFNCYPGGSAYQSCGSGLLFDNTHQDCNWPADVTCSGASVSPSASPSPSTTSPSRSLSPSPSPSSYSPGLSPSPSQSPVLSGGSPAPSNGLLFSPYKDITINMNWNTDAMSTDVTGTLQPITQAMPSGMTALTWAFATGECGQESWGGVTSAGVASNINAFVAAGKRYILSTGGADGVFTCGSDSGFNTFISSYQSANLLGVDFDIEGGQSQSEITNLVQRVLTAQTAHPGLRFSFTIATLGESGGGNQLNSIGTMVMQAIQSSSLSWNNLYINLMTMDYGSGSTVCTMGSNGVCDMAQSAISAAESLHSFWGVPYSSIELTPMIGGNDVSSNVFTIANVATVVQYALSKGLGGLHYWSFDRDVDCAPGSASATCNSYGTAGTLGFAKALIAAL